MPCKRLSPPVADGTSCEQQPFENEMAFIRAENRLFLGCAARDAGGISFAPSLKAACPQYASSALVRPAHFTRGFDFCTKPLLPAPVLQLGIAEAVHQRLNGHARLAKRAIVRGKALVFRHILQVKHRMHLVPLGLLYR